VILTETLDRPGQCWIESKDGRHAGEFVMAFTKKKEVHKQMSDSFYYHSKPNIQRVFPVGSEWLYAKIYCGTKTAEKILCNVLKPLSEDLLSEKLTDKFFFLRYRDQAHHLRVRFHNATNGEFWKEVISRSKEIFQPYFDNRLVNNLQIETYRREAERYGLDTMDLSENIFWHHSERILSFISLLEGDEGEQYRWQICLKAIDLILNEFSYSLEQKSNLVKNLNQNFSVEFKIASSERKKISERFNQHKRLVNFLLSNEWETDENLSRAVKVFTTPKINYYNTIDEILRAPSVIADPQQLDRLMSSYLHMFINRMFVSNQRKTELVLYEYLLRYYESKLARNKIIQFQGVKDEISV